MSFLANRPSSIGGDFAARLQRRLHDTHDWRSGADVSGHFLRAQLRDAIHASSFGYKELANRHPHWVRLLGAALSHVPSIRSRVGCHVRFLQDRCGAKLLDVGCGNGNFLAAAEKVGWRGTGLEPDPVAASIAKARGCQVIQGNIEDFHPSKKAYDAITLDHVLEHLHDARLVLSKLKAALANDGVLVSVTPNPGSLVARIFGVSWYGLDPPRHLHIPSASGLTALFHEIGFESRVFTVPRISRCYASESMSIRTLGHAHKKSARFIPRLLGMAAQLSTFAGLNFGEEIVCIATKRQSSRSLGRPIRLKNSTDSASVH